VGMAGVHVFLLRFLYDLRVAEAESRVTD
jgi:hypothetical protein